MISDMKTGTFSLGDGTVSGNLTQNIPAVLHCGAGTSSRNTIAGIEAMPDITAQKWEANDSELMHTFIARTLEAVGKSPSSDTSLVQRRGEVSVPKGRSSPNQTF